jgi:hypothetical protein
MNDITIHIVLVVEIVLTVLVSKVIDAKTVFLPRILAKGKEIYMECPRGM